MVEIILVYHDSLLESLSEFDGGGGCFEDLIYLTTIKNENCANVWNLWSTIYGSVSIRMYVLISVLKKHGMFRNSCTISLLSTVWKTLCKFDHLGTFKPSNIPSIHFSAKIHLGTGLPSITFLYLYQRRHKRMVKVS